MKQTRYVVYLSVLLAVIFLAACAPGEVEPGATGVGEVAAEPKAPEVGPVVPFGPPETRDLQPTTETVPNCNGATSAVVKHPSITVGSAHSVEWEIGGSVGVGVQIGSDLAPASVNLEAALEGHVARDINNSIQFTNAWDLPADPGYIMEYTIMWREIWQPGYIDATFLDPEPEIMRINVRYRTGIESDIVGDRRTACNGAVPATQPPTPTISAPIDTPQPSREAIPDTLTCDGLETKAIIAGNIVPVSRWQSDCAYSSVLNGQTILLSTWGILIQRSGAEVIAARLVPPKTNTVAPSNSVLFAGYMSQESADAAYRIVNPGSPTPVVATSQASPTSDDLRFQGWLICWHGRDGYEYLIAYPESQARSGISLNFDLTNAQDQELELANDSLKMCLFDDEWYGRSDNDWFPNVSYMQLTNNSILVCSEGPGCQGSQWTMLAEKYYPGGSPSLQAPSTVGIHVISWIPSQ